MKRLTWVFKITDVMVIQPVLLIGKNSSIPWSNPKSKALTIIKSDPFTLHPDLYIHTEHHRCHLKDPTSFGGF